jgi:hypothetical protein
MIARYVLIAVLGLGVLAGAVSWFQMSPDARSAALGMVGRLIAWGLIVLILPWATYFITTAVARRESNSAGVLLVAGYTVADIAAGAWLLGTGWSGTAAIIVGVVGLLIAIAYNILACDWIADRLA